MKAVPALNCAAGTGPRQGGLIKWLRCSDQSQRAFLTGDSQFFQYVLNYFF